MSRVALIRVLTVALSISSAAPAFSAEGAAIGRVKVAPSSIVVGFVGGFVSHDSLRHGPVKLAESIRHSAPKDTFVQVFENRHRKTAYQTILGLLDRDHDGVLSKDEKSQARIILFGHSWGASAVIMLARELNRAGIPVLLTVQVDSVAKLWQNDSIVPENVTAAVNFYQPHGVVRGRTEITAADSAKTQILGNYRFDYRKDPVRCENPSWYDRYITPGHAQIECDPHIWSQVESLVRQRLEPQSAALAALPQP
jgi:hypothetical protein